MVLRLFLLAVPAVVALDNGAALTPPMGWSTWNRLKCKFDAQKLLEIADSLHSSGMVAAGYTTLNVDDCWPLKSRDGNGRIVPDPEKFPNGMKNFSLELNKRGLTLGIYTSHTNATCQHYPGSYGHEDQDAQDYADWGVTFVKNDWCKHKEDAAVDDVQAFNAMRDAINRTGHRMTHSVHWTVQLSTRGSPWLTANMWRGGRDISPHWSYVMSLLDWSIPLANNSGPGQWNDMDMLEVGNGMTEDEDRAHFTMWCMLASPLIAGNDVTMMSDTTRQILTNRHALEVSQDPLGRQAVVLANGRLPSSPGRKPDWQVFGRPLTSPRGSFAVALLNRNDTVAIDIMANFSSLGADVSFRVLDLWDDARDLGVHTSITMQVPLKSAKMYKLVPVTTSVDVVVV